MQPAPSKLASATALSNHSIEVVSYEIPKGIFRGALWPQKDKKFFEIWIIDDDREKFFELKSPPEFVNYEREVTDSWQFKIIEKSDSYIKYLANKKDGSKSLHVELPNKKRDYSFAVAKGESKDLILTAIKPEISVFKEQTNKKVEKFDEFIKELEKKYQDQYVVLEKEVQKLKLRNEINKLKERAMLRDGAPALQSLAKISHGKFNSKIPVENEEEKEAIQLMAKAMVNSVVDYYINVTFLRNHTLLYKDDNGVELKNGDIPTEALIDYLSKDNFKDWALAARLLGNRKEIKVAEALLDRIYNDSDVEVLKEANKSFCKLTGEYRGDIPVWPLTEYYILYWEEKKEKIGVKFKKE